MLPYRLLVSIATPLIALLLLARRLTGRVSRRSLAERLGGGAHAPARPGGAPLIWLHGASNGELTSARPLVDALRRAAPDLRLLITANTESGRALAEGWGLSGTTAALAPLDHRAVLARFLHRRQPAALVVVENELWPNRLAACGAAAVAVVVIGARMSMRSARRWAWFGRLTKQVLGQVTALSAQDPDSEARFLALGLPAARLLPRANLKSAVTAPTPPEAAPLRPVFDRATTVLAASTHEGEEAMILAAFAAARAQRPALRLILAPRHPRRSAEVAALIGAAGLRHATRSRGEDPALAEVYLADTLGEMTLWYALAGVTFVGGSLVDRGGHTPFEPAAQHSAIVHGPHVANFRAPYAALDGAGAAHEVCDAAGLATALLDLADLSHQSRMGATAAAVLAADTANLTPLAAAILTAAGLPKPEEPADAVYP